MMLLELKQAVGVILTPRWHTVHKVFLSVLCAFFESSVVSFLSKRLPKAARATTATTAAKAAATAEATAAKTPAG